MDRPQNKSCYVLDTFPTTQHNYIQKITSTHAQTKLPNEVLISSRWKHLDSSLGMKFQYRLSSMPVIESAIDEIDMQTPRPPLSSQNSYTMSHTNFNISCLSRCKFASCNAITDTSSRTDVVRLQTQIHCLCPNQTQFPGHFSHAQARLDNKKNCSYRPIQEIWSNLINKKEYNSLS